MDASITEALFHFQIIRENKGETVTLALKKE